MRHLSELGFEPAEKARRLPPFLTRPRHPKQPASFGGRLEATGVHIRLRRRKGLELHITFTPRVSQRRAAKLISRLGLRHFEGTWA